MNTLKGGTRAICAVLVAVVLMFGVAQAGASATPPGCVGSCPPLEGGYQGSCWYACIDSGYVGGDCTPSPPKVCCCFTK